ncbi:MAG TPA: DUF1629 domain-containing protein, partial [Novosphingobium sp.]|nr:DUF1629 domain-containing protein [Novosphingobium sp.]
RTGPRSHRRPRRAARAAGGGGPVIGIPELLRQVPEEETQLFGRSIDDGVEDGFFAVAASFEYWPRLEWHNGLPLEEAPWCGSRQKQRIPVSVLPPLDVTFDGFGENIVDFYGTGCQAWLVSDRLVTLIEELDPGSLDRIPVRIETQDGTIDYNLVMPSRNLEVVDPLRTDVLVADRNYGGHWLRSVQFPGGVVFRTDELAGVHSFSDIDVHGWFWSRRLIDAAKAGGIKGLYTSRAGVVTSVAIDSL